MREDESQIKYPDGMDLTDPDQLLREALKELFTLHLYLNSNPIDVPDDIERAIAEDFILFAPNTQFVFSWHHGSFPELEYQLQKVEKYYRLESKKLERQKENQSVPRESHLL